jgi:hypothetical protein
LLYLSNLGIISCHASAIILARHCSHDLRPRCAIICQQKAARHAGQSEYRHLRAITTGAGNWTLDRAVRGIGPKRLEKMRKYLLVTNAPAKKSSSPAKKLAANSPTDAGKKPPPPVTKPAADAEEPEEP